MGVEKRQMAPVMTIDEARQVLRMRKQAVYALIKIGVLVTFKRGGRATYCTDTALRTAITHLESIGKVSAQSCSVSRIWPPEAVEANSLCTSRR
jgi:hypothetical protein